MSTITCNYDGCDAPATRLMTIGPVPLAPLCDEHEWVEMRALREVVARHDVIDAISGWRKFCAERGYDPDAGSYRKGRNR